MLLVSVRLCAGNLRRVNSGPLSMSSKLESIAGAAVKAADKVGASLIICITHTGESACFVSEFFFIQCKFETG